jgi:phage shock protein A
VKNWRSIPQYTLVLTKPLRKAKGTQWHRKWNKAMGLFERINRVARAEANDAMSEFISPEQEMNRAIGMLQDAVLKTHLAIGRTPPDQAGGLRLTLRALETKLSSAKTRRNELVHRMMEVRLKELDKLTGNDLSELIGLLEQINSDIAAMKTQLSGSSTSP